MTISKTSQSALTLLIIFVLLTPIYAFGSDKYSPREWAIILNLSGRQRMLTQKISKELLLMAVGIDIQDNYSELLKTSTLFSRTLKGLQEGDKALGLQPAKTREVKEKLKQVENMWEKFRPVIDVALTAKGESFYPVVTSMSIPLLNEMNEAVQLFEKQALKELNGSNKSVIINYAGRQRMLIQKMSKEMILLYLNSENRDNLLDSIYLFEKTLYALKDGGRAPRSVKGGFVTLEPVADPAIDAQIDKVIQHWLEFQILLHSDITIYTIRKMAELNTHFLQEMDIVVKMYETSENRTP